MTLLHTSVVVVSRGRPACLHLCLTSLALQNHPNFEVILVTSPEELTVRSDLPLKRVAFDQPNISIARNLGIAEAAGRIIAFIDDDSVAEPGWLLSLSVPFADPRVIAATGWTRSRDGFSWQAQNQYITATCLTENLPATPQTVLLPPPKSGAISTLGTNCAFRAEALRKIGGFDPVFSYHLDESDVNMRMAMMFPQGLTAIVPKAQVIHTRAASEIRNETLAPYSLKHQGRSDALFARRYGTQDHLPTIVKNERHRLIRHMLEGRVDPQHVGTVLETLRKGIADGQAGPFPTLPAERHDSPTEFMRMPVLKRDILVFGGWHWQAQKLRSCAAKATEDGGIVTLILLTPTLLSHRIIMTNGGWFEQWGGVWGPSEPEDAPFSFWYIKTRLQREKKLTLTRRNSCTSVVV